jgi:hypothetical protein
MFTDPALQSCKQRCDVLNIDVPLPSVELGAPLGGLAAPLHRLERGYEAAGRLREVRHALLFLELRDGFG